MGDSRRFGVALSLSLAAHALGLLLLFLLVREHTPAPEPVIDSAVFEAGPVTLYLGRTKPVAKAEDDFPTEEQMQHVRVEPSTAPSGPGGTAPQVAAPSGVERGSPGASGSGSATFFGSPVAARSVVYVIDRSLSMGVSGKLADARAELLASLRSLPSDTTFQVLLYNRSALPLPINGHYGLHKATKDTIDEVARRVGEVRGEGGTDHVQALQRGLGLKADVLFLVTDADDLSPQDVVTITRLNAGRTIISTVDLGTGSGFASSLRQLATDNRGGYVRRGGKK